MSDYTLALSESELQRYRYMAQQALETEHENWAKAGIKPGVRIADVGCGPGAISVTLAELIGPEGQVRGVDLNPEALGHARKYAAEKGLNNLQFDEGSATDSGIEPGWADVVMMRHVLAHNGGQEQAIVDHLATLVRPGGSVYLVDIDASGMKVRPSIPEMLEMNERYSAFHARRGNDLSIGLRLDELLEAAGLEVTQFDGRLSVVDPPPGIRPPVWAARETMLAEGVVTEDDIARWGATMDQIERDATKIRIFLASFIAVGRRPA